MKGYTSLQKLHQDTLRHAERIRARSHTLDEKALERIVQNHTRQHSHPVTRRLQLLEQRKQRTVDLPVQDRDVNVDIQLNKIVVKHDGLCINGVLLNYPVDTLVGSIITTKPVLRYFFYRNHLYAETKTRWFRVHGPATVFDDTPIPNVTCP